jgi:hypothetical protein
MTSYRPEDAEEPQKKSIFHKLGLVLVAVAVLVFAKGAGFIFGRTTVDRFVDGRQQGQLEAGLQRAVTQIRSQVPIKVDADTTMIDAIAAGRGIMYVMTVNADIPDDRLSDAKAFMQQRVSRNVCSDEKAKALITAGATMTYQYHLPSGSTFSVAIDNCT